MADFSLYARSGLEHLLHAGNRGDHTGEPGVAVALRNDLALAYVLVRNGKTGELQTRVQERFGRRLPMGAQSGPQRECRGSRKRNMRGASKPFANACT